MEADRLEIEVQDNIGIVRLNHPATRNALGSKMIGELIEALHELEQNPTVNIIVLLSGLPKVFSAGRDLSEGSIDDIIDQRKFCSQATNLWGTLHALKKVTIAGLNGYVLAGGCGIAVCCDLALATEDAVFGLPEINVGLFPVTIAPAIMRNTGLAKKCFQLFVTGDKFSAAEAEELGIINQVVPADKLEEKVLELARSIASKSPTIIEMGRNFFYAMREMEYTNALKYAHEVITIMAASHDGIEGQNAFMEKRKPQWQNT